MANRATKSPVSVTIRTYHVGFGDCFLLSFRYGPNSERHVLVDFGSTGLPDGTPNNRMDTVAQDIAKRCGGKLHGVVATHRHKDHISGFATKKNGKGTGDTIRSLKPDVVVQPWTEDLDLATTATGPKAVASRAKRFGEGTTNRITALGVMHAVAGLTLAESKRSRHFSKDLKAQLQFLGEDNLANKSAVENLRTMGKNHYVYCGAKSGLEPVLPGVNISVLGPPTVKQTDTIKKQRSRDPDEFWHFQAKAMDISQAQGGKPILFPRHVGSRGPTFPIDSRWLIYHARSTRGEQLLQIVRMLDGQMNNTSVILVFQVGKKSLLFPGDAQLENWQYALEQKEFQSLLKGINLYKVGHHGSLNATPKSLWALFKNRSKQPSKTRLTSLMSTMKGKHGTEGSNTEVPRRTLKSALRTETDLFTTEDLKGPAFFHDTTLSF